MMQTRHKRHRRGVRLIPFLLLVATCLFAAPGDFIPYTPTEVDPVRESWRWTSYPELAGTGVRRIAQTPDGALWFGVEGGVRRYDGLEWMSYSSGDGIVGEKAFTLHVTSDGTFYVGTERGVSRFDGDRFQRVFPTVSDRIQWNINALHEVDGELWIGTGMGLVTLGEAGPILHTNGPTDPALASLLPAVTLRTLPESLRAPAPWSHSGKHILDEPSIGLTVQKAADASHTFVVAVAPEGPAAHAGIRVGDKLLLSASYDLITMRDSVDVRVVKPQSGDTLNVSLRAARVEDGCPILAVVDILPSPEGIWVGTMSGSVLLVPPAGFDAPGARRFDVPQRPNPRLARTPDGTLWIAGNASGPLVQIKGNEVVTISIEDRFPDIYMMDIMPAIMVTADSTLWVGHHAGGLSVLDSKGWSAHTKREGNLPTSDARVTDLLEAADGSLWLVQRGRGALRLDRSSRYGTFAHHYLVPDPARDGTAWFGVWKEGSGDWKSVRTRDGSWQELTSRPEFTTAPWGRVTPSGRLVVSCWDGWPRPDCADDLFIYDENGWQVHRDLPVVPSFQLHEAADRSLWIAARAQSPQERATEPTRVGLLRLASGIWTHLRGESIPAAAYGITQTPDGRMWFSGGDLRRFDGTSWDKINDPPELGRPWTQDVRVDAGGALWVSTRSYGVFRLHEGHWQRYGVADGLSDDQVKLAPGPRGEVWFIPTTHDDVFRFDGHSFVSALPAGLLEGGPSIQELGGDAHGTVWVSYRKDEQGQVTRIRPDDNPPQTWVTLAAERVSQPGNTVVSWRGVDRWNDTPVDELRFSSRLDGGDWSPYTTATNQTFLELSDGAHTIEVRSRDRDFNVDATPAVAHFTVVPPVWKQAWFIGLVSALLGAIAVQSTRVLRRERRLARQNRDLLVEAALERVRVRALAMETTDQIGDISTQIFDEFRALDYNQSFLNIVLIDEDTRTTQSWAHIGWGESRILQTGTESIREDLWDGDQLRWQRQKTTIEAWRRGEMWNLYTMSSNDLRTYFRKVWTQIDETEFERRLAAFGGTVYGHSVFHRYGQLSISGQEPLTDDGLLVAKRFADLFAFAYSRHLELEQKQQRTHELALESASARIRAEAMAMESTQDMARVAGLVAYELRELGVQTQGCMIYLLDDEQQIVHWYLAYNDLDALGISYDPARVLKLPTGTCVGYQQTSIDLQTHGETIVGGDGHETRLMDDLRSRGSQVQELSDEQVNWAREHPVLHMLGIDTTDENFRLLREEPGMVRVTTYWGRGMIATRSSDMAVEDAPRIEAILTEFSDALALGFQRFLDFQQLEQASANKSQFLRRMSHDLRSPMNAIIGYSRLLRRRLADKIDERDTRNLSNIETSSGNLLNLINDILDLSRIEAGRIEINEQSVDVEKLADECADALESIVREGVVLRRDLDDVGVINSDPDRLRQVVMNLLGNATKFTESGSITLSLRRASGRMTSTDSSSAGPVGGEDATSSGDHIVEITVADTGIGIPADDLPHIFDEFRQVERQGGESAEGTGLGLAIAKKTVDLLGGEMFATSEVGVGTTFTVRLGAG